MVERYIKHPFLFSLNKLPGTKKRYREIRTNAHSEMVNDDGNKQF